MRRLLLLGTIAFVLGLSAASAHGLSDPDSVLAGASGASTILSDGDAAPAEELHWIGQTFGEDVVILLRDITLLGVGALVIGVGGVCINARRSLGGKAFSSHADHAPV
jgi:hypothetical protein